jgi:alkanesulfonate monooxygenase SsuD/methylene tetrahydromethanopterin reductase-like flavin-dependent oxidoreductase (luciferase family)
VCRPAEGRHPAWRLPGSRNDGNSNPRLLQHAARTAERGRFDFFFIGDRLVGLTASQFAAPNEVLRPEALTLAAKHRGDHRAHRAHHHGQHHLLRPVQRRPGGGLVTGKNVEAARNFGREQHWDNEHRYDWATEYIQVLQLLWDSWEDDAPSPIRAPASSSTRTACSGCGKSTLLKVVAGLV